MSDSSDHLADPELATHVRATRVPSPLDQVAAAIAAFTEHPGDVYVERFPEGWRWSPAHRGGPYPLLREVAQFLGIPHTRFAVRFRTVDDEWTVLMPDDPDGPLRHPPEATAIVAFTAPARGEEVRNRILAATEA